MGCKESDGRPKNVGRESRIVTSWFEVEGCIAHSPVRRCLIRLVSCTLVFAGPVDCVSLVVLALSVVLLICFSSDLVLADEVQVVAADDKGALHLGGADDT